jgi:hypothetical protein
MNAPRRLQTGLGGRIISAAVAIILLVLLSVSAWLTPSTAGTGTHTQLGLQPCGWMVLMGKPCVTCGMTTSFALAAEGQYARSLLTQPMGLLLCLAAATGFWILLHTLLTGGRAWIMFEFLTRPRSIWLIAGLAGLAWAYKVAIT